MLHILKRQLVPIAARFEKAISLTYAFPPEELIPLLAPGLALDTLRDLGFLAVTTVHTLDLRPAFLPPAFGREFFLTSYRLFARFKTPDGSVLRGLQTLRSDTNSAWLVKWGNRMTRYGYRKAEIEFQRQKALLQLDVRTPNGEADLALTADLSRVPASGMMAEREFIAPLPITFDYEPETRSIIIGEGQRTHWQPRPCAVEVHRNTFLQSAPVLAGAFFLENVRCRWSRGRVVGTTGSKTGIF